MHAGEHSSYFPKTTISWSEPKHRVHTPERQRVVERAQEWMRYEGTVHWTSFKTDVRLKHMESSSIALRLNRA